MAKFDWVMPAIVLDVHDGDTFHADVNIYASRWDRKVRIRVRGIDTPELTTPDGKDNPPGLAARDYAETILVGMRVVTVILHTAGYDDRGRILAAVELPSGKDFGTLMLAAGHAKPYP